MSSILMLSISSDDSNRTSDILESKWVQQKPVKNQVALLGAFDGLSSDCRLHTFHGYWLVEHMTIK